MSPYEDLFFCFFFAWFFVSLDFSGSLDLLRPNVFGEKRNGGQASGWTYRTRAKFQGLVSEKRRGHLDFRAENIS